MRKFYIIIAGLAIVIGSSANATIINIPYDYPTIQTGIDSSSNGDTVLVADGTYYEHINFLGKSIVVKSENGATSTIIDKLVDYTPLVTFESGEDSTSVLNGFTIKNATSTGIYCDSGSAKIENNIIEYNTKDPDVDSQGGAITIRNCIFPIVIRNNIIRFNDGYEAGFNTGGIYAESASLLIIDSNSIYQNIGNLGGGIFTRYSCTKSKYNLIYKNHALTASGIYYQYRESGSLIINNTIVDNLSVIGLGASIYLNGGSEYIEVKNNIVVFNQDRCIKVIHASDVHVSYNCLLGSISGVIPEEGNIYIDPLFVDMDNDDYSLLPDSPCINNGDPSSPLDPDGTPADMGALYFQLLAGLGDLSGVVQDIVGNPIPGASVNIDSLGLNYITGPDGIYFFDDLDATWRYQLSVSHDSYIDTVLTNVWVFDDETTYVDIVLDAFSYISGVVTNPNTELITEPIKGVIVQVLGDTTNADTTYSQGEYFINWIINGAYDITFSHPQYIDTLVENIEALPNDTTELDVILGYTGFIAGTVTNSSMLPINGVIVSLPGYDSIVDTTDVFGEYSLDYIDPGIYVVFFSHAMFVNETVSNIEVFGGEITELNITLIGYGVLLGVVTDTASSPIFRLRVTVEGTNPLLSAYTNYNGVYEILDIPEGAYDISFSRGGYFDTTVSDVSFTRGDTTWLDMQMIPKPTLEYVPGDFNMYIGIWPPVVIGSDLTYLVNFFRGSETSQRCELDGFWCSADANGDCNIIGSDVTRLRGFFRGNITLLYCPDYPPAWPTPDDLPDEAPSGWPNCEPPVVNNTKIIPNGSFK